MTIEQQLTRVRVGDTARFAVPKPEPVRSRFHPLARCSALDADLDVCAVRYGEHAALTHGFEYKHHYRVHLPWDNRVSYCGRGDYMEIALDGEDATVQALGIENRLCTGCFKTWIFLQRRKQFLRTGR